MKHYMVLVSAKCWISLLVSFDENKSEALNLTSQFQLPNSSQRNIKDKRKAPLTTENML